MKQIERKDMTYAEAQEVGLNHGKCGWCRQHNKDDRWYRTGVTSPGFHLASAPCCEACAKKREYRAGATA